MHILEQGPLFFAVFTMSFPSSMFKMLRQSSEHGVPKRTRLVGLEEILTPFLWPLYVDIALTLFVDIRLVCCSLSVSYQLSLDRRSKLFTFLRYRNTPNSDCFLACVIYV